MSCRDAWYAGDRFDSVLLMRAVVIYESMFGDAAKVARSIGAGLADVWGGQVDEVTVVEVGEAPTTIPDDVDLLVVGSPTHAFGLPRPSTRADAAAQDAGARRAALMASLTPQEREQVAKMSQEERRAFFRNRRAQAPAGPQGSASGAAAAPASTAPAENAARASAPASAVTAPASAASR